MAATEDAELSFEQGLSSYNEGSWADSLGMFDAAIKADPNYAPAHHYRGMALLQLNQPGEAVRAIETSRKLDPNAEDINLDLGMAYARAGRNDDAVAAYKAEIAARPDNARAHFSLGYQLVQMKRYEEALAPLDKAAQLDPNLAANAAYYKGLAYMELGKKDEAANAFRTALKKNPSPKVAEASKKYLAVLEPGKPTGKTWGIGGTVLYQYDSNVMVANDMTVFPVAVNDIEISRQEDSRVVATLMGTWRFFNTKDYTAQIGYSFYQSFHFELDMFNLQNHSPELTLARNFMIGSKRARMTIGYHGGAALLGNDLLYYSSNHAGRSAVKVKLSDTFAIGLSHKATWEDFEAENPNRDNVSHSLALDTWLSFWSKKALLKLTAATDWEDAIDSDYDLMRPWGKLSLEVALPWKFRVKVGGTYEYQDHFETDDHRIDRIVTGEFMAFRPIWGPIEFNVNFNYRSNESTLDIYTYERYIAGGGLVVRF